MRKGDHNVFANVLSLLICGLLAGVVVAAAAFPAIAMSGLAAKTGAQAFADLPSELTVKRSPQMSKIYASDGRTLLASIYDENRQDIPIDEIPKVMQQAMVAAEDHKFYEHNGVDVKGIARAFVANKNAGETEQGASTLTMQYVRLSITYAATDPNQVLTAAEDTSARKLREVKYALAIEKRLSKAQILEGYLNIAYFGNHAYGIYAASQVYFGKEPKDLTIPEAAFLAGLVKSPSDFNPVNDDGTIDPKNFTEGKTRRDWVIDQMHETGAISEADQATAKATELKITGKPAPNGCIATLIANAGFFCDYLQRWWMQEPAFGANSYERERALKSGGYKIISSLDVPTQNAAKKNVEAALKTGNKHALMVVAVEPGTGKVRAMAVNRNFKIDDPNNPQNKLSTDPAKAAKGIRGSYPNTVNPLMSTEDGGYQFGSTFKMFTAVAALEHGYPLDYTINAPYQWTSPYVVAPGPATCGDKWCPHNASQGMTGTHTMWGGFGRSVNTYFAQLIARVGPPFAVASAKELGLKFRGDASHCCSDAYYAAHADEWGAFTLGVTENTPLEMANAYATLAADGTYCQPIPVEKITDHNGKDLDVANPRCEKRVDTDVARAAVDMARCPMGDDSAFGKCTGGTATYVHDNIVKRPVAGKTGTTDDNRTASMIAMTKQLAVAGIVADPDWILDDVGHINGKDPHRDIVNPAVAMTLRDGVKGKPVVNFSKPVSQKIIYGTKVSIPVVTCKSVADATSILKNKGFTVNVEATPVSSPCPAGTVAGTTPSGSTSKNSSVGLQISDGKGTATPPPGGGKPNQPPPPRNNGTGIWQCPPICLPADPLQLLP